MCVPILKWMERKTKSLCDITVVTLPINKTFPLSNIIGSVAMHVIRPFIVTPRSFISFSELLTYACLMWHFFWLLPIRFFQGSSQIQFFLRTPVMAYTTGWWHLLFENLKIFDYCLFAFCKTRLWSIMPYCHRCDIFLCHFASGLKYIIIRFSCNLWLQLLRIFLPEYAKLFIEL